MTVLPLGRAVTVAFRFKVLGLGRRYRARREVQLTAKERQALDQLHRANGVLARWPVVVTGTLSRLVATHGDAPPQYPEIDDE